MAEALKKAGAADREKVQQALADFDVTTSLGTARHLQEPAGRQQRQSLGRRHPGHRPRHLRGSLMRLMLARRGADQALRRPGRGQRRELRRCRRGQVMSIVGPNGAGKTTLFNLITGVLRPDAGDVVLRAARASPAGRRTGWPRSASARTFQNIRLFAASERARERHDRPHRAHARRRLRRARLPARRAGRAARRLSSMPRRCSIGSASARTASACRASCPTATSAGSRSPARWRSSRVC